jgi:hypothetical protein
MWKFKKSKTEASPRTKTKEEQAFSDADKVLNLADDHFQSLVTTTREHKTLGAVIENTEYKLKELGEVIDKADRDLSETNKAVAEKFDSLSATFTALCEKVKKGNLPTTALGSSEAAEVLQPLNVKRGEVKAQQKAPGAN